MVFFVPSLLIYKYSPFIAFHLGSFGPSLLFLGAAYAAVKRYNWLTASSILPGSTLVKSLRLTDSTLLINDKINLNVNSAKINLVEGDFRRESLYVIRDNSNKAYVMPLNKNSVANVKALNSLVNSKPGHEEYSIRDVLALGQKKLIDTNKTKTIKSELDSIARINLLHSRNVDLVNLSVTELHQKLNSIPDSEVNEYLENVSKGLTSAQVPLETNLVAVENLLTSFGIDRDEAVSMTQSLRRRFAINSLNDLSTMSKENLKDCFNESVTKSNLKFDALYKCIQTFCESLSK
jgi:hypothetical protein